MKAVIINRYGPSDVLETVEIKRPAVYGNLVLVRIMYTSVNPVDWKIRNGMLRAMTGGKFPIVLGYDVAGEVVETGPGVARFKKGDRVFSKLCQKHMGAYAEYAVEEEGYVAHIPDNLGYREAAAVPLVSLTAYQALHDKADIKSGENVLINGASGGVGTFAVQIAKAADAKVTGVCGPDNAEMVRSIGADDVIDYAKQDVSLLSGGYDVVFDAVGKLSFMRVRKALTDRGRYVSTLPGGAGNVICCMLTPITALAGFGRKAMMVFVRSDGSELVRIADMLAEGKLVPVIDREYTLDEIKDAHNYSEKGHARGKIVVRVP